MHYLWVSCNRISGSLMNALFVILAGFIRTDMQKALREDKGGLSECGRIRNADEHRLNAIASDNERI